MPKNPHAVALGRRGGLKGGPARARKMPAVHRKAIGLAGALARHQSERPTLDLVDGGAVIGTPAAVVVMVEEQDAQGTKR